MPPAAKPVAGVPGLMSPDQIAEILRSQYGLSPETAAQYAQQMIGAPRAQEALLARIHPSEQLPIAPPAAPMSAAAPTPQHLEDANVSSWQRYSHMLDAADGQSTGRRTVKPSLHKGN